MSAQQDMRHRPAAVLGGPEDRNPFIGANGEDEPFLRRKEHNDDVHERHIWIWVCIILAFLSSFIAIALVAGTIVTLSNNITIAFDCVDIVEGVEECAGAGGFTFITCFDLNADTVCTPGNDTIIIEKTICNGLNGTIGVDGAPGLPGAGGDDPRFENVTRIGKDLFFTGMNLHILDGSGDTPAPGALACDSELAPSFAGDVCVDDSDCGDAAGACVGCGNLIIGYNERFFHFAGERVGSHVLVIGENHLYSAQVGIVAGLSNTISGAGATVTGGQSNRASGIGASISGGQSNIASGDRASVSGGNSNTASGRQSSVSGGGSNSASSTGSSVSGGDTNEASGEQASILGGNRNIASGPDTTVSGGVSNLASGFTASMFGGSDNVASGSTSSISGGSRNTASGAGASVSGGSDNTASGNFAFVSSGQWNLASGTASSVSGGGGSVMVEGNSAIDRFTSVSGGQSNVAGEGTNLGLGQAASILGGELNFAIAPMSGIGAGLREEVILDAEGAFIASGTDNTAGGVQSFIGAGNTNNVTGTHAFIGAGFENSATGLRAANLGGSGTAAPSTDESTL